MKADIIRIIAITAATIGIFSAFGHAGLGLLVGIGVMCGMADEYNHKYNNK